MKNERGATTIGALFIVCLIVVAIGGWIANIVALSQMSFDPLTGMAVLRIVGIFLVPLGAIMGFL